MICDTVTFTYIYIYYYTANLVTANLHNIHHIQFSLIDIHTIWKGRYTKQWLRLRLVNSAFLPEKKTCGMQELSETRRDAFSCNCVCGLFVVEGFFGESDMDNSRPKSLPTCQHFSVGDLLYIIYRSIYHKSLMRVLLTSDHFLYRGIYGYIEGHLAGDRKDRNPYPPLLYIYEFGPFKFKQARGFVPLGRNSPYTTIVLSILFRSWV